MLMRSFVFAAACVILTSCSNDSKTFTGGTPVFGNASAPAFVKKEIKLDKPRESVSWESAAGALDNNVGNLVARDSFRHLFSVDIGYTGTKSHSLYPPIISGEHFFAIDGGLRISKFALKNGSRVWRVRPFGVAGDITYGSLAIAEGALFAASNDGQVARIDIASGKTVWKRKLNGHLKGSIKACGGRLLLMDGANRLAVLSTDNGETITDKLFLDSSVGMIRGSTPACSGDVAVIGLQNGEVLAKSLKAGDNIWSARAFVGTFASNNTITDIVASPVIFGGKVLIKTYGGGMRTLDLKTGREIWRTEVSGRTTPIVSGGVIFDADDNNMLRAIDAANGKEIWSVRIASSKEAGFAQAVLLLNSRIWVFMSEGEAFAFAPQDGKFLSRLDISHAISAPVSSVGGAVFVPSVEGIEVWQ